MKYITTLVLFYCLTFTGCQVMEIKYSDPMAGDAELSNVKNVQQGKLFASSSTSVYIFDLGPVHEGSIARSMEGKIAANSDFTRMEIITEFGPVDTFFRIIQTGLIGVPLVGTRTINIKAIRPDK